MILPRYYLEECSGHMGKDEEGDWVKYEDLMPVLEKLEVFLKHMGKQQMREGHFLHETGHFQELKQSFEKLQKLAEVKP